MPNFISPEVISAGILSLYFVIRGILSLKDKINGKVQQQNFQYTPELIKYKHVLDDIKKEVTDPSNEDVIKIIGSVDKFSAVLYNQNRILECIEKLEGEFNQHVKDDQRDFGSIRELILSYYRKDSEK